MGYNKAICHQNAMLWFFFKFFFRFGLTLESNLMCASIFTFSALLFKLIEKTTVFLIINKGIQKDAKQHHLLFKCLNNI